MAKISKISHPDRQQQ
jgi:hypothetical protein